MGNFFKKEISKEDQVIINFVNTLLNNANINNKCIPDKVEKQLYFNLLKILIGNLTELSKTFRIEFLNHRITINFEAITDETTSN